VQPVLDSSAPRKHVGQHIYDWVNNCDLTQLDAIMLATFVLTVGCGTIGGLFLMGFLQNAINAAKGPPMVVQTVVTDRGPVQYRGFVMAPQPQVAPHMEPTAVAAMQAGFRPPLPWFPTQSPAATAIGESVQTTSRFGRPRGDAPVTGSEAQAAQPF
jgi:hypothetical protein